MRIILPTLIAGALSACAVSGTQVQADCETRYAAIGDIVQCTRTTLAQQNPSKLQDPKAKLYLLRGEQLSDEVAAGRMTNSDARVAWQRMYVELWEPTPEEKAARLRAIGQILQQQSQPSDATYQVVRPPTSTVCTSNTVLGQIRTECQSR